MQIPERALDVLAYFLRNPGAADTLEGIARWRLLEEGAHRSVREADEALAWLLEHDFLLQDGQKMGHWESLVRLNQEKIEEAAQLVRRHGKHWAAERQRPERRRRTSPCP